MRVRTTINGEALMNRILLAAAATVAFAAPAFAADIPPRTYTKAPVYTAPQVVYNWTGFYIGGHLGGAFAGDNSLEGSGGRFMGGVQGGFDYQFATNWVRPLVGSAIPGARHCCTQRAATPGATATILASALPAYRPGLLPMAPT